MEKTAGGIEDEDKEELLKFRQLWIEEVKQLKEAQSDAMNLYKKGVAFERQNDFGPAVTAYRAAMKMDPEVEKKYAFRPEEERKTDEQTTPTAVESVADTGEIDQDGEDLSVKEPVVQKSKILNQPVEIIVLILQQVAVIDLHCIFTLAQTCSMLSKLIKHDSIWSFVCENHLIPNRLVERNAYRELPSTLSWFERFKEVPHLRIDGIYISKVTYKRQGMSDLSVRLANLSTVHLVTYYRYVRFLPGSDEALILITHKEPHEVVAKINLKASNKKMEGLIRANFIWVDEQSVVLKWLGNNQKNVSEFLAHLILTSSVPGQHNKLKWANFSSRTSQQNDWIPFPKDQLKSFWFSRVRSY